MLRKSETLSEQVIPMFIQHSHWHRCLRSSGLCLCETRMTLGNPPVRLGDQLTISHAADGYQTINNDTISKQRKRLNRITRYRFPAANMSSESNKLRGLLVRHH